MTEFKRLAVLGGAGMIGRAMLGGILKKKLLEPGNITITARHAESLARVDYLGVVTTLDNAAAIAGADAVILAVHPDQAIKLVEECADAFKPGQLLISIVTATPVTELKMAAQSKVCVVRAIPNIAAIVGASVTSITVGPEVGPEHLAVARAIFESIGTTVVLDEKHLNACTGLGGCGPAFAFKVIESLSEGGVKMGLPRHVARAMAAGVLLGAAKLVLETDRHPAALKDEVTTPGGCTIDGITKLEERGLPIALIAAVEASTKRAAELNDPGDR